MSFFGSSWPIKYALDRGEKFGKDEKVGSGGMFWGSAAILLVLYLHMSNIVKLPQGKPWNRTLQEAQRLSISEDLLVDLFNRGIVPGLKISTRIILFNPEKTDAALVQHFSSIGDHRERRREING